MSAEDHDEILMASRVRRRADAGVAANARLTASNAAILLVLLAAEGVTILRVRELLTPHVFIGMVLVPPVLSFGNVELHVGTNEAIVADNKVLLRRREALILEALLMRRRRQARS